LPTRRLSKRGCPPYDPPQVKEDCFAEFTPGLDPGARNDTMDP
jgi:hypothetical protein